MRVTETSVKIFSIFDDVIMTSKWAFPNFWHSELISSKHDLQDLWSNNLIALTDLEIWASKDAWKSQKKRLSLYDSIYIHKSKSLGVANPLGSCSKSSNFRASRPLPSNSPSNFTLKCCSNFSSSSIFTFSIFWPIRSQLGPIKGSKYRFRALRLVPFDLPSNFT